MKKCYYALISEFSKKVIYKPQMNKKDVSVTILVPCYNEGKTLRMCVLSWLKQTSPADEIIIVNDCSTDNTLEVLQEFKNQLTIINLPENTGNKSLVQEKGLEHIKTDVFVATDADTIMDKHFIERVRLAFRDKKVNFFSGYVKSLKHNWLTACREIDYTIGQDLHKTAQNNINFLLVIPGCAGAFRTEAFRKLISFDHDTLTEDMDFTYKINKTTGNIYFDKQAIVHTQDPDNLKSYINQMRRWYGGGWQNLMKHIDIIKHPIKALELSLMYIEGLVFFPLIFLLPIISLTYFYSVTILYFVFTIGCGVYAAVRRRRIDLFFYSPLFFFLNFIHAYVFLEQFIKEVILKKKNMVWFHPERREMV